MCCTDFSSLVSSLSTIQIPPGAGEHLNRRLEDIRGPLQGKRTRVAADLASVQSRVEQRLLKRGRCERDGGPAWYVAH